MAESRYDVFLSHNSKDKPAVERIAEKLRQLGLEPWLDKWHLAPGRSFQDGIDTGLNASRGCAVFLSEHGIGAWQKEELEVAQNRATNDPSFALFLVLLPGFPEPGDFSALPSFLRSSPGNSTNIIDLAFRRDDSRLAVASDGILVWDVTTDKQIGLPWLRGNSGALGLAFSPDGSQLVSASTDGSVLLGASARRRWSENRGPGTGAQSPRWPPAQLGIGSPRSGSMGRWPCGMPDAASASGKPGRVRLVP